MTDGISCALCFESNTMEKHAEHVAAVHGGAGARRLRLLDRVRYLPKPKYPVFTVASLFLHGDPEVEWAGLRDDKELRLMHVLVSDLEVVT